MGAALLAVVVILIRWSNPWWIPQAIEFVATSLPLPGQVLGAILVAILAYKIAGSFVYNAILLLILVWVLPDIEVDWLNSALHDVIARTSNLPAWKISKHYVAAERWMSLGIYTTGALILAYLLQRVTARWSPRLR